LAKTHSFAVTGPTSRSATGRTRARGPIRESPQRLDAAKRQLEEMGGRFVGFWMTLGQQGLLHGSLKIAR
jgi:hypothetical protein